MMFLLLKPVYILSIVTDFFSPCGTGGHMQWPFCPTCLCGPLLLWQYFSVGALQGPILNPPILSLHFPLGKFHLPFHQHSKFKLSKKKCHGHTQTCSPSWFSCILRHYLLNLKLCFQYKWAVPAHSTSFCDSMYMHMQFLLSRKLSCLCLPPRLRITRPERLRLGTISYSKPSLELCSKIRCLPSELSELIYPFIY